jgi:restriction system protein
LVSLHIERERFDGINLDAIDPKQCFRSLKGIAAPQLAMLAPVAPIMQLRREDPRFIPGEDVDRLIDGEVNLAAIGWEEFEQLIRRLFEKEFAAHGGEVKVTRTSRDAGVDAVIFDPDPVRGGKIVIQAKRYNNTVDVSSVRDLYETVLNEGANKGILVTTSGFGPDAYSFAKDKPISLMDGANLLFLLAKHGTRARLGLKETMSLGLSLQRRSLDSI